MIGIWIAVGVVALFLLITIRYYNRFIVLANRIKNSLSQIDVQLKRRADLVPNLIETVKGFAKHEKEAINAVTKAREALVSAKGVEDKVKANNVLEGALGKIFALAEGYPDLKANTNFLELQKELSSTEDRIAYARQNYNDSILVYNNMTEQFPGVIFAGMFKKKPMEFLKIEEAERKNVKVSF